jgi:hypothetical protein
MMSFFQVSKGVVQHLNYLRVVKKIDGLMECSMPSKRYGKWGMKKPLKKEICGPKVYLSNFYETKRLTLLERCNDSPTAALYSARALKAADIVRRSWFFALQQWLQTSARYNIFRVCLIFPTKAPYLVRPVQRAASLGNACEEPTAALKNHRALPISALPLRRCRNANSSPTAISCRRQERVARFIASYHLIRNNEAHDEFKLDLIKEW